MQSRIVLFSCMLAIVLLMVCSLASSYDEHNYPRMRKLSNGAWLSAHHFAPAEKRGRFVFREAPFFHRFEQINEDSLANDDEQNTDFNFDKRNWRL